MSISARLGLFTALWAALGLASCEDGSCEDGDRTFADGAIWTCSDGCNSCSCNDGETTSTLMGCPEPPGEAAGKLQCFNGDEWVAHGRTWACDGGCCECVDGDVATTPDAC